MISISVCSECSGKGSLVVNNAYNAELVEEVQCEYCMGTGVFRRDWEDLTGADQPTYE
jgi:DnaJ-class molecular chaperone